LYKRYFGKGETVRKRFCYYLSTTLIDEFQVAENVSQKSTEEGRKQLNAYLEECGLYQDIAYQL